MQKISSINVSKIKWIAPGVCRVCNSRGQEFFVFPDENEVFSSVPMGDSFKNVIIGLAKRKIEAEQRKF